MLDWYKEQEGKLSTRSYVFDRDYDNDFDYNPYRWSLEQYGF